ncbi:MAG: hypothetical protein L0221_07405, partial [Chloroflexi bacterium]|nr:hypothetical protein [Chloroflexota bacterium]
LLCPRCAGEGAGERAEPAGALAVPAPVLAFLVAIGGMSLPDLAAAGGTVPAVLRRAEEVAARVRRGFLGHELKSYEVMRRTLAEVGD